MMRGIQNPISSDDCHGFLDFPDCFLRHNRTIALNVPRDVVVTTNILDYFVQFH